MWDESGYRLDVDVDHVDFRLFEVLADEGRRLLDAGESTTAREVLTRPARCGAVRHSAKSPTWTSRSAWRCALEERRLAAAEDRLEAELNLGYHGAVTSELTELVAAHPLRERLQGQLALALYRSGRQAEALRALDAARVTLRDELGLELSRPLRDLESAILAQDADLDIARPVPTALAPSPTRPPRTGGLIGRDSELAELVAVLDESADDALVRRAGG